MQGHIKNWTLRVQNRVKYLHPDSKFRSIPFSRGLFSASRAHFPSRMSPLFCFKITNPGLQKRQIPYPHKPIGDPRQWISFSESCQCLGPNGVVWTTKKSPVNSVLTDTCLRRTPGVGPCRFLVNYTLHETDTSLRRTTDTSETVKPTYTWEVRYAVKNTSKQKCRSSPFLIFCSLAPVRRVRTVAHLDHEAVNVCL